MEYLLGIDFGGSSSKATLIDCNGNIICTASHEYPMYYPQDGFCEQAAEDCYEACIHNILWSSKKITGIFTKIF